MHKQEIVNNLYPTFLDETKISDNENSIRYYPITVPGTTHLYPVSVPVTVLGMYYRYYKYCSVVPGTVLILVLMLSCELEVKEEEPLGC